MDRRRQRYNFAFLSLLARALVLFPERDSFHNYFFGFHSLNKLFGERSYLCKTSFFDFSGQGAENAPPFQLFAVQNHNRVIIKTDVRPVRAPESVFLPDNQSPMYFSFFNNFSWLSCFYSHHYDISYSSVAPSRSAQYLNTLGESCSGIISYI